MSAVATRRAEPAPGGADPKARIEAVATRLFIRHGYNGTSYLDIARELGTTHSRIHYYFRTKDLLAEAVLRRVSEATLATMRGIWTDPRSSLSDKFVATRDWTWRQYLEHNPGGRGGRLWGLLARFTMDADALSLASRRLLRASVERLDDCVATGVRGAVAQGELAADAPVDGIALQIASLMAATGQLTRRGNGFERLHDLMRWTYVGIVAAYGVDPRRAHAWPALPPEAAAIPSAQMALALDAGDALDFPAPADTESAEDAEAH